MKITKKYIAETDANTKSKMKLNRLSPLPFSPVLVKFTKNPVPHTQPNLAFL